MSFGREKADPDGIFGGELSGGRGSVVGALRENGPSTRAEVARLTGLSRTTVSNVVAELLSLGVVVEGREGRARGAGAGRPGVLVVLNPRAGAAVGVDVGHRYLRVVVADLAHRLLAEEEGPLAAGHDASEALALAGRTVERLLAEAGVARGKVIGVGMALSGPVGRPTGEVRRSSVSPSWVGTRPAEDLGEVLGLPVLLDNGANLSALAESVWGAARGARDALHVAVSDGIGAGLILDGKVYRGASGVAGEIGHVTVDERGPMCGCGKRGCLEALASTSAVLGLLQPVLGPDLTIERTIGLALEGNAACRRVIGDAGRLVGVAVSHACNLLDPERVVVGGRLVEAGGVLLDPLREAVRREALHAAAETEVVAGQLGLRARALGGVALALRETDSFVAAPEGPVDAETA